MDGDCQGPFDGLPFARLRKTDSRGHLRLESGQGAGSEPPQTDFITLPNQTDKPAPENACDEAATMLPAFGTILGHEFGTHNELNSLLDGHRKAEARTELVAATRNLQAALAVFAGALERDGAEATEGLVSATGEALRTSENPAGRFAERKPFKP